MSDSKVADDEFFWSTEGDDKRLALAIVQGAEDDAKIISIAVWLAQHKHWRNTGFSQKVLTLAQASPLKVANLVRRKAVPAANKG